ncbi:VTT domain-containing protein [Desulfobaculum sp. SPO524]|uniref:VTT domain-containing protein n=1 Tax=Desulfobaculum sp. SPO524 TaxID=3378071 RepID=UPI003854E056
MQIHNLPDTATSDAATARSNRTAFLIDAQDYFRAVAESIIKAERSVIILGWDIDSRIRLRGDDDMRLHELLNHVVTERPDLHIHVLIWDFPLPYSFDREPLQEVNFPRKTHKNIHFHLDDELPVGSSHHQKVIVIDDAVAYVGGMDVTGARWDTPEHQPQDPRRTTPGGDEYGPYHDIQMVVDDEMATLLGNMARKRWLWATEEALSPPPSPAGDPWPESVTPALRDHVLAMALTLPPYKGRRARREIEALYLDNIAKAQQRIYIENQYFTSASIRDAIAKRLAEANGPDILIVINEMPTGLLEQLVMEPLQSDVFDALYEQDTHGRLAVYCPYADKNFQTSVKVHAKLLLIDDAFVTVGSANLNDRSMGLDSECNLALRQADGDAASLRDLRRHLIAHHLGVSDEEYANEEERSGMLEAVKALQSRKGRLLPEPESRYSAPLPVDPELARPLDSPHPALYDSILDEYSGPDNSQKSFARILAFSAMLAAFVLLAVLWRYTPLSRYVTPDALLHWAAHIRELPLAPLLAPLAFVFGGLVMFPVTLLIVLTASIFSPAESFAISTAGCLLSAFTVYSIGEYLGHDSVRQLAGSRINALSQQLGKHGLASIVVVRILPVAPFSIINLVAGASHIKRRVFLTGTVLGMIPGIIGMTLFGGQLMNAIRNPGPMTFGVLGAIIALVIGLGMLLRRRLRRVKADLDAKPSGDQS